MKASELWLKYLEKLMSEKQFLKTSKNLNLMEVCAKFGGDWSGGSLVKEGHTYIQSVIYMD